MFGQAQRPNKPSCFGGFCTCRALLPCGDDGPPEVSCPENRDEEGSQLASPNLVAVAVEGSTSTATC